MIVNFHFNCIKQIMKFWVTHCFWIFNFDIKKDADKNITQKFNTIQYNLK